MSNPVKTSVIVLNWNGWQDTLRCLESLQAITEPDFDVLVVDNGSTDDSVQKIEEYISVNQRSNQRESASISLIKNAKNAGFAGGNNVGIKTAYHKGADYIVLLNNDTVVDPDFLKNMLEIMEKHHTIGLANPKIYLMEEDGTKANRFWFAGADINWLHTRGTHRYFGEKDEGQIDGKEYAETDYATGCCLMIRRQALEEIHLMPEDYFLYYEDAEWSLHARKEGWLCAVIPAAKIWHRGAASTRERSVNYVRYHVRGGLFLCLRTAVLWKVIVAYLLSILRVFWHTLKWIVFPEKRPFAAGVIFGVRDAWLHRTGEIKN